MNRYKNTIAKIIAFVFLIQLVSFTCIFPGFAVAEPSESPATGLADSNSYIKMEFDKTAPDVGDIITASIKINNIDKFAGYQVSIKYDTNVFEPVDLVTQEPYDESTVPSDGDILISNSYAPCALAGNKINSGNLCFGKTYINVLKYLSDGIPEKNGTLAKIGFKVLKKEKSFIRFQDFSYYQQGVTLYNWNSEKINTESYSIIQPAIINSQLQDVPLEDCFVFDSTTGKILNYTGTSSEVVIPDTIRGVLVKGIGYKAFWGGNFESITLPKGLNSIGDRAFSGCSSLKSIIIPEGVTSIDLCTFDGCKSLTDIIIPESVTDIGSSAFAGCNNLRKIRIPASVSNFETNVFYECNNLLEFDVDKSNLYFSSEDGVLFNKEKTWLIQYPSKKTDLTYKTPNCLKSISNNAFKNCNNLTGISINSGLNYIGDNAFINCSNLVSIDLPNTITYLGYDSFIECSSLKSIVLPNQITTIYSGTFDGCTKLSNVTIPQSVTRIDSSAFSNCDSLTDIIIPKSVTEIDQFAFDLDNKTLKICGMEGSYAQKYAADNGIPFITLKYRKIEGTIEPDWDNPGHPIDGFCVEAVGQPFITYTDASGHFELDVYDTVTTCDLKISKPGYLSREIKDLSVTKDLQFSKISIWAGDIPVNGISDNAINMVDIMQIAQAFNAIISDDRFNDSYDFQSDCVINMLDIMVMARHFNTSSEDYGVL